MSAPSLAYRAATERPMPELYSAVDLLAIEPRNRTGTENVLSAGNECLLALQLTGALVIFNSVGSLELGCFAGGLHFAFQAG